MSTFTHIDLRNYEIHSSPNKFGIIPVFVMTLLRVDIEPTNDSHNDCKKINTSKSNQIHAQRTIVIVTKKKTNYQFANERQLWLMNKPDDVISIGQ